MGESLVDSSNICCRRRTASNMGPWTISNCSRGSNRLIFSRFYPNQLFCSKKRTNKGRELGRYYGAFKNVLQPFRSPLKNIINLEQAAFSERAKSLGNASVWGLSDLCPDSKRNKEDFLVERRFKSPRDSYISCFQIYELNEQFADFMFCKLNN